MICVGHLKFGGNDRLLNFNYDGTQRINCLQFDFESNEVVASHGWSYVGFPMYLKTISPYQSQDLNAISPHCLL